MSLVKETSGDDTTMPDIGIFQPCGGHLYASISPLIELFAGEDSRDLNTYFLAV